ncbi:MAG: hypothetical protein R6T92_00105 [Desulfosalsimonadaceae bacterium]
MDKKNPGWTEIVHPGDIITESSALHHRMDASKDKKEAPKAEKKPAACVIRCHVHIVFHHLVFPALAAPAIPRSKGLPASPVCDADTLHLQPPAGPVKFSFYDIAPAFPIGIF